MKILVHGAVLVAALAFAAAAQAGPGNDGYGQPQRPTHSAVAQGPGGSGYPHQEASAHSRAQRGPGNSVPYAVLHRHHTAHWRHARLSARDHMANQLNREELARVSTGAPAAQPSLGAGPRGQVLHCYNPSNPDCD